MALLQKVVRAQREEVGDWDTIGPQVRILGVRLVELNDCLRRGGLSERRESELLQEAILLVNLGNQIRSYIAG